MPRTSLFALGWLVCSLTLASAQSGSVGGDVFFDGYQLWKKGEKLEQEGKKEEATRAYLDAYRIIGSVAQNYPDWQPDVVGYRLKNVEQSLQRLGYNMGSIPGLAPMPPSTNVITSRPGTSLAAPAPGMPSAPAPVQGAPTPPATASGNPIDAINQQFQSQQQQIDTLLKERDKLLRDLEVYSRGYMGAAQEREQLKAMQADLQKRLSEADKANQAEMQRLKDEAKIVADKLAAKSQQYDSSAKFIETLQKDKENFLKEKEAMVQGQKKLEDELAKMKRDAIKPDDMTKIIADNARLKQELEVARKQVEKLKAEGTQKDQEIASLKSQITSIKAEVAKLRQENTGYQTQVAELTLKYKEMSKELAAAPKKGDSKEVAKAKEENAALRAIIMRQLRQQERTRQAKELVIAEMKKMESASETLMENLEDLTSGKLIISVEEEPLFTEPELKEFLATSGVTATLEATSSKSKGTTAARTPPKSGSPSATTASLAASNPGSLPPNPILPAASGLGGTMGTSATSEEKLMMQADAALKRSDYQVAELSLEDALRTNPKNTIALTSLAGIKLRQKKYEEAEVLFQKTLVYSPNNGVALYSLGVCYFRQNKLSDALTAFEKTVLSDRSNSKAHHYLGIIASNMSNRSRAEAEFKSALAIDPTYGDAHFNLAVLYATSSPPDYDRARKHYDDALERGIKPDGALEKLLKSPGAIPPNLQNKGTATASSR